MFNHKHDHGHGHGCGGPSGRDRGGSFGGRFGGGGFGGRGPRMFDPGALRLVVLGLIGEEPRHGYDVIKALEAKFQGAYSPSPGAVYPMLQMLEEADLVTSSANGNKRLYTITDDGKAYLAENQAELDRINAQVDRASERFSGVALGDEARGLMRDLFSRVRDGSLTNEQATNALEILRKAREEIGGL